MRANIERTLGTKTLQRHTIELKMREKKSEKYKNC